MLKKSVLVLTVFFVLMTLVAAPCFCAHPAETMNQVSIQKSHSCCPSNSDSHCKTLLSKSCSESNQKIFVLASPQLRREVGIDFAISAETMEVNLKPSQFFHSTPFFEPQNRLFLTSTVLRI